MPRKILLNEFTLRLTMPEDIGLKDNLTSYIQDNGLSTDIIVIAFDELHHNKQGVSKPHYHILIKLPDTETIDKTHFYSYIKSKYDLFGNKEMAIAHVKDLQKALTYHFKPTHQIVYTIGLTDEQIQQYKDQAFDPNDFKNKWQHFLDNYTFTIKTSFDGYDDDEVIQPYILEILQRDNKMELKQTFYHDCFNFLRKNHKRMSHFYKSDMVHHLFHNHIIDITDIIKYHHLP